MPYNKNSKRSYRKKRYSRNKGKAKKTTSHDNMITTNHGRRAVTITMPGIGLFPDTMIMKHSYTDLIQTSGATGSHTTYSYRSSMTDPDTSGVAKQPLGRDQLITLYDEYVITGIAYDIMAMNISSGVLARTCVSVADTDKTWTDFDQIAQQPLSSKVLALGISTGGSNTGRMTGYIDVGKVYGMTRKAVLCDDLFSAVNTSDPTNMVYLQIHNADMAETGTTDVHYQVSLTYYVQWRNPAELSES